MINLNLNLNLNNFLVDFRLPFYWRSHLGFLILLAIESFVLSSIGFTCVPLVSFTAGSCWLINSLVKDITNDLINFNVKKGKEVRKEANKHLCNVIKNFADVKQLSGNF